MGDNKKLSELPELPRLVELDDLNIENTGITQLPWLAKLPKLVPETFAACESLELLSIAKRQIKMKPSPELKKKLR